MADAHPQLSRLAEVMHRLRSECPWDARQTHESLVSYLVEESLEVVEAIEAGSDDALCEELGDLLLQVFFHAEIASESDRFDIERVAAGIADKLVARHPYVFSDADLPGDLTASWEQAKAREKRRESVLEGIPERLSALSRADKVMSRAASWGIDVDLPAAEEPDADAVGVSLLALVARSRQLGVDPEQAARAALRHLEAQIRQVESAG